MKEGKNGESMETMKKYEIKVREDVKILTNDEKEALFAGSFTKQPLQAAYFIFRCMLAEWRERQILNDCVDQSPPVPSTEKEKIASKMFFLVKRNDEMQRLVNE